MDIGALLNQAGGASAIAQHLGVDEATVERGAGALVPHVVNGVQAQGLPADAGATDPQALGGAGAEPDQGGMFGGAGGMGGLVGGLLHAGGSGGGILGSLVGGGAGNQILGHIFGSKERSRDVAAQASQQSGVDSSVLKKLLPIVAGAVAMHYMTRGRQGGSADGAGGGGLLGSILGGGGGL
jgi:hypothetical protein